MAQTEAVYHPEWLALEAHLGSRPAMTGNIEQDIPAFNHIGTDLAKMWKPLDQEPTITNETIKPGDIPIRIYKPQNAKDDLPLIVYYHGGGYISGNLDTEDPQCRYLSSKTPCVVVSIDYPLAPANQLQTIIDSSVAAAEAVMNHEPKLTSSNKVIIAGGSAGGSLATQVMHAFVQSGNIKDIAGLHVMFPFMTNCGKHYQGPYAVEHTSYKDNATGVPFISTPILENAHNLMGVKADSPSHCVLLSDSSVFSQFPRTYVVTAEHDPCRDDGRVFVKRLNEESKHGAREDYYPGFPHYFHWFPAVPTAYTCMDKAVEGLQWVINGD